MQNCKYIHNTFSAITILALNPDPNAVGWKIDTDNDYHCNNETDEQFIECIEGISYMTEDIILNHNSSDFQIKDFFTDTWGGIAQSVEMKENVISSNFDLSNDNVGL